MKIAQPLLYGLLFGGVALLLGPISDGFAERGYEVSVPFFAGLALILAALAIPSIWATVVCRRIELAGDDLIVSSWRQSAAVPLRSVVSVTQRTWPNGWPVRIELATPCLGKTVIRFMPSVRERMEAESRLSLWQQFRLREHPIVAELNRIVAEARRNQADAPGRPAVSPES